MPELTTSVVATSATNEVIVPSAPPVAAPATWAKAKSTPDWILAGAYHAQRWDRDAAGNDLHLITESDFDTACKAVASISLHSAHQARKG